MAETLWVVFPFRAHTTRPISDCCKTCEELLQVFQKQTQGNPMSAAIISGKG